MPRYLIVLIALAIIALVTVILFDVAYAYALPGTATAVEASSSGSNSGAGIWSGSNVATPFENFWNSLVSVGGTNFNVAPAAVPNFSNMAADSAHGAFEQFDAWLAGITGGFHISSLLTLLLSLFSWLLGFVKGIIDWLLSWIH
jgi:hypothetical protein